MVFDIFVLTSFMCCFYESFSSRSTPRKFVAFSHAVATLYIFKKGSGSLNSYIYLFIYLPIYLSIYLRLEQIENILFLLNLLIIYLL